MHCVWCFQGLCNLIQQDLSITTGNTLDIPGDFHYVIKMVFDTQINWLIFCKVLDVIVSECKNDLFNDLFVFSFQGMATVFLCRMVVRPSASFTQWWESRSPCCSWLRWSRGSWSSVPAGPWIICTGAGACPNLCWPPCTLPCWPLLPSPASSLYLPSSSQYWKKNGIS